MTASDPADRKLIAKIAANARWGNTTDRTAKTAKARSLSPSSIDYWLAKVDEMHPNTDLSQRDRERAAANLKTAHFQRLALASAKARKRR